jgi:Uma2 family endonuclease
MPVAPASATPHSPSRFENPCPFRFTREQYYRLTELGFFGSSRVELLYGEIIEKYPNDPADPSPRPFRFTREQYYRLGELGFLDGRHVELIRGEIVVMSPIKEPHVASVSLTTDVLKAAFGTGHYVRVQAPLNLGTTDPEPDLAVVAGGPRDYAAPPTTALLIVEVADTSLHYDTTTKAEEYATAGVADYWVLDLNGRQLLVFRDPAPIPDGGAAYRNKQTLAPNDTIAPLAAPNATIRVTDLLP